MTATGPQQHVIVVGTPFSAYTRAWPTEAKIHRAKASVGVRVMAVCGRTFRDIATSYAVADWDRLGPPAGLPDMDARCVHCVTRGNG